MFKRKKWKYLILDEAHMIKNWKSQRWQTLLNFNSKRRLLITGALLTFPLPALCLLLLMHNCSLIMSLMVLTHCRDAAAE